MMMRTGKMMLEPVCVKGGRDNSVSATIFSDDPGFTVNVTDSVHLAESHTNEMRSRSPVTASSSSAELVTYDI
jgi:hypothetical protein